MIKKNMTLRKIGIVALTLVLMVLVVFLVSASFGYFNYMKKGDTLNVISIKGIDVEIINDSENNLNINEAYPMYDDEGILNDPFTFTLTNTSSKALDIVLKIENDTDKQGDYPLLSTNYIKYVYKIGNGEYSEPQNLGANNNIVLSDTITRNETKTISIKLWLDKEAPNSVQGKYFFGELIVEGTKAQSVVTNIYSAVADEVYYYDSDNQKVVIGTTDETGKLENAIVPKYVVLYSSVAKDPNNLSNPYSKEFTGTNTNIYLMPEGKILYWYGYDDFGEPFKTTFSSERPFTDADSVKNQNDWQMSLTWVSRGYNSCVYVTESPIDATNYTAYNVIVNSGSLNLYNHATTIEMVNYIEPNVVERNTVESERIYTGPITSPVLWTWEIDNLDSIQPGIHLQTANPGTYATINMAAIWLD